MMALGAMVIGCERHDFEETRKLHDKSSPEPVDSPADGGNEDGGED